MRKLTAVVIASAMVLCNASARAAEPMAPDDVHHGEFTTGSMTQNSQSHMFDGIELTEHQRQQMRDLMQQARHDRPATNIDDIAAMHDLVTADNFNEAAIRLLYEGFPRVLLEQQVEMARVRNQMYHLLPSAFARTGKSGRRSSRPRYKRIMSGV